MERRLLTCIAKFLCKGEIEIIKNNGQYQASGIINDDDCIVLLNNFTVKIKVGKNHFEFSNFKEMVEIKQKLDDDHIILMMKKALSKPQKNSYGRNVTKTPSNRYKVVVKGVYHGTFDTIEQAQEKASELIDVDKLHFTTTKKGVEVRLRSDRIGIVESKEKALELLERARGEI